jgi:hypothetical protein
LVCVSILLLILGTGTAWYVYRLQKDAADILALNVSSVRAAEDREIGLREIRTQINEFLLSGDRQRLARVPALRKEVDRWLADARRVATASKAASSPCPATSPMATTIVPSASGT